MITVNKNLLITGSLVFAVFASSIALVYCRHVSRAMFVKLEQLQQSTDDLNIEWSRLQLEEGAWAEHGRIEDISRRQLNMKLPPPDTITLIRS